MDKKKEEGQKEEDQIPTEELKGKAKKKQRGMAVEQRNTVNIQKDYEVFLQDLEEDREFRSHVNLYKDLNAEFDT